MPLDMTAFLNGEPQPEEAPASPASLAAPPPATAGVALGRLRHEFGTVNVDEIIALAATDHEFYCQHFFPKTFRQSSPAFHRDIWTLLEDQEHRRVAIEVFRGGAKTTILRAYTSKRIAYGISRTIVFVSASQDHSKKSLQWLRKQVTFNKVWADTYGLAKGAKWTDELIEIKHKVLGITITVIALGITGQTRGINIDDYRPDLIIVDDPCDLENTATIEQRRKTEELFFGSLDKSLTPASENPDAKMALLQTSLHQDDLINLVHKDTSWETRKFGIFDEEGRSRWPQRFPTKEIQTDKQAHISRNQLSLWLREMECTVTSEETSAFKASWLQYWRALPEQMICFMGVDPAPPPVGDNLERAQLKGDFEVISVIGVYQGNYYLLEYAEMRGHQPEWTVKTIFELWRKWRPVRVRVEGVAYQRVLKWILSKEMEKRRQFFQVNSSDDKRKKVHRILQAFSGIASEGRFYVHPSHVEFVQEFVAYPKSAHDDHLDAVAMAIDEALESGLDYLDEEGFGPLDTSVKVIEGSWMSAP